MRVSVYFISECAYVCAHACMRVYTRVCVCAYARAHAFARVKEMCFFLIVCARVLMCTRNAYACVRTCMCVCV